MVDGRFRVEGARGFGKHMDMAVDVSPRTKTAKDARDPLQVLQTSENGVTNVINFLTDITTDAVNALAVMMDVKELPSINHF